MDNKELLTNINITENDTKTISTDNTDSQVKANNTSFSLNKKNLLLIGSILFAIICFFIVLNANNTRFDPYKFKLEAYGETLGGDSSEMLKDCYFKINSKNNKITMYKAGQKYKGAYSFYVFQNDYSVYEITWENPPKIVAGYDTYNKSLMWAKWNSSGDSIMIAFPISGYIGNTYVDMEAWYYRESN